MRRLLLLTALLVACVTTPSRTGTFSETERIASFWVWFAAHRSALEQQVGAKPAELAALTDAVHAIDPLLAWDLGRDAEGHYLLVVTGEGALPMRRLADHVVRRAPKLEHWRFLPARPPTSDPAYALTLDGHALPLADARFRTHWNDARRQVDVDVQHPGFTPLSEKQRQEGAFRLLDAALGEDAVERQVGRVTANATVSPGSEPLAGLRESLAMPRDAGPDHWVMLRAEGPMGERVTALVDTTLHPLDHLDATTHVRVRLLLARGPDGLSPDPAAARDSDALEDAMMAALGKSAIYAGRETWPDRRDWHFYAEDADTVVVKLHDWAIASGAKVEVDTQPDPEWKRLPWR